MLGTGEWTNVRLAIDDRDKSFHGKYHQWRLMICLKYIVIVITYLAWQSLTSRFAAVQKNKPRRRFWSLHALCGVICAAWLGFRLSIDLLLLIALHSLRRWDFWELLYQTTIGILEVHRRTIFNCRFTCARSECLPSMGYILNIFQKSSERSLTLDTMASVNRV
jgi:hypothetical protein